MDKPSKYNSNDFFVKIGDAINNLFDVAPGELINNADGIEELIKLNVNSAEDDHAYAFSVFNDDILKNFYQFLLVADDDVNDGHDPRRDSNLNISLLYLIDKCDKYINNVESGRIVSDNFLNFTYNIYKMAKDIHNSIRKQTLAESVLNLMRPFLEKDEDRLHKIYGASKIKGYSAKEFADYLRGIIIDGAVKASEETIEGYDRHGIMDDIRKALEGRYSEMLKWGDLDGMSYDAKRLREYINKGNKIDNMVSQAERKAVEKFDGPLNDAEKRNLRSNIEWLIDVAANYPNDLVSAYLQKRGEEWKDFRNDAALRIGVSPDARWGAFEPSANLFDYEVSKRVHTNPDPKRAYLPQGDTTTPHSHYASTGVSLPPEDKGTSLLQDELKRKEEANKMSNKAVYDKYRNLGGRPHNVSVWEFNNNAFGLADKYETLPKDVQDEVDLLDGYERNLAILKAAAELENPGVDDVKNVETEVALDNWIKTNYMGFGDIYRGLSDEEKKIVKDLPDDEAIKYLLKKTDGSMLYGRNKFNVDDAASLYDK